MAKVRSPNYPAHDLATALAAARMAFDKDNRNKMSQAALSSHLGHDSLSGPALGKIAALRAFGLIDGKGDELRITDDAVDAIMAPQGSPQRAETIARIAARPKLFHDIQKDFPTTPSLENLRYWLIKREFAPDAAEKAAKCYLNTMRLVTDDGKDDSVGGEEQETLAAPPPPRHMVVDFRPKMLEESFNLEDGPVKLTFPAVMSVDSYQDLADRLEIVLRQAKRRAEAETARRQADREDVPD